MWLTLASLLRIYGRPQNFGTKASCGFFSQLVEACNHWILMPDIFQEAGLPLWLRPYEVLVTSSYTALIETIPDTVILYIRAF